MLGQKPQRYPFHQKKRKENMFTLTRGVKVYIGAHLLKSKQLKIKVSLNELTLSFTAIGLGPTVRIEHMASSVTCSILKCDQSYWSKTLKRFTKRRGLLFWAAWIFNRFHAPYEKCEWDIERIQTLDFALSYVYTFRFIFLSLVNCFKCYPLNYSNCGPSNNHK